MRILRARSIMQAMLARPQSVLLRGPEAFPMHAHDFPEVFWVSRGRGVHHINGHSVSLVAGSLVYVRAKDAHAFGSDDSGMLMHNVPFAPRWFDRFRRRHYADESRFWSGDAPLPQQHLLTRAEVAELNTQLAQLAQAPTLARAAERFLLNLLHLCPPAPADTRPRTPGMPDWIEPALRAWATREQWIGGTRALARLAGRSEAHVSREVNKWTGRTPTDWLNAHRMRHAAYLLAFTDRKVLDIALDCGFDSLGYFYAIFLKHHGCSPARYRKRLPPSPLDPRHFR